MATRKFNLFARLYVLRTNKETGARFWIKKMETRLDESFTAVPIIKQAVETLQDQGRVDLNFDPDKGELTLLIEEIQNAQKRTRSSVTEAAFDAWVHKIRQMRKYAREVFARTPANVQVELTGWHYDA